MWKASENSVLFNSLPYYIPCPVYCWTIKKSLDLLFCTQNGMFKTQKTAIFGALFINYQILSVARPPFAGSRKAGVFIGGVINSLCSLCHPGLPGLPSLNLRPCLPGAGGLGRQILRMACRHCRNRLISPYNRQIDPWLPAGFWAG